MKSILFVINTFGVGGGAEKALLELIKQIDPERYEVHLFVLTGQGNLIFQLPQNVRILNKKYYPVSILDSKGKIRIFKTVLRSMMTRGVIFRRIKYITRNLTDMIRQRRIREDKLLWKIIADGAQRIEREYDLAVAYLEGGSAYYVSSRVKAKKKAAFIHIDYLHAGYNRKLDEDCYLLFDHIFAVSEHVRDSFVSVYPECEDRTTVFYNLLNREEIIDKSMAGGGFSDAYDGVRILTVGRLVPQKAISLAIETMHLLKKTGRPFRWYVLGEGDLRNRLEAQIHALQLENDFYLLGMKENPYPYYAQCDLYVHPAYYEGKSVAVEEAQILGCVILASGHEGVEEQILDGVDGKICEFCPEAFAGEILDLVDHPQRMADYSMAASKREQTNNQKEIEKLLSMTV